jgi:hypothetical protein
MRQKPASSRSVHLRRAFSIAPTTQGTFLAQRIAGGQPMSYVKLLGFSTMACGCTVGRYHELATDRVVSYIEQKGDACAYRKHRRNQTVRPATLAADRSAEQHVRAW